MMTRKEVAQLRELAEKARDLGAGIVSLPIGQFFDLLDFLDFQEDEFSDDPIECNLPFERVPQHAWDPGIGPVPPRPKVEPLFPTVDMVTPAEPSPTPQQDARDAVIEAAQEWGSARSALLSAGLDQWPKTELVPRLASAEHGLRTALARLSHPRAMDVDVVNQSVPTICVRPRASRATVIP